MCSIFPSTGGLCKNNHLTQKGLYCRIIKCPKPLGKEDLRLTVACLLLGLTLTSLIALKTLSLPQFPIFFFFSFCLPLESCPQHNKILQKHSLVLLISETPICHEQKVQFGVEDLGWSLDPDI